MIKEAIILAGGFGTRLQKVVSEVPKPMADISGKPFLYYLLTYLQRNGIQRIVFSIGYKADIISDYFKDSYLDMRIDYAREEFPLGTGGGLKYALTYTESKDVLVVNGDSFYDIDLQKLYKVHEEKKPSVSFSLKKLYNENRYGGVEINEDLKITNFLDKTYNGEIYINAGVYLINKERFNNVVDSLGDKFSLETEYFLAKFKEEVFVGVPYSGKYFLDIGIPEDYLKAQKEIVKLIEKETKRKNLFLDRDGVINNKIENGYVLNWEQFHFKKDFIDFIQKHNDKFSLKIVVTNQRCVGRGLISADQLKSIHGQMIEQLKDIDVTIDKVYFCPEIDDSAPCRKPNAGMLIEAEKDFSELTLDHSTWFIGDSLSDMQAGKKAGVCTILVSKDIYKLKKIELADFIVESLDELDEILKVKQ
ncbi:HAD-IIIA family hydrolase [Maribacter spongiicola]|uniref:HAD-IIIA family hydrolase n=1 Tax=Maribacter spongiicola TaxID=1206753 RepID=UPI003F94DC31